MVKCVVGSWGSYLSYNSRSLGSSWLDFSKFKSSDDLREELISQGFRLDGVDEELFIQDIEGLPDCFNCDYMHPETLFKVLKAAGVLDCDYAYSVMLAFLEVRSWSDFVERVERWGSFWHDDIIIHEGASLEDVARDYFYDSYSKEVREVLESLDWYIDFEGWGRANLDAEEYSGGIIEIY